MPGRLEDKVVIVTGGGGGFGQGIATKFIQEGAKVIIADVAQENGSRVAKELGCEFHLTDVTKRDAWEALLKKAVDTHGKLDIVVDNAGGTYMNKVGPVAKFLGSIC
jgi:NADP-dependent 3-hydroxy acid dehydrogenase YdfG